MADEDKDTQATMEANEAPGVPMVDEVVESRDVPLKQSFSTAAKAAGAAGDVMSNKDIWVHGILPFLGPGNFLYVALVSKAFKKCYLEFFSTLQDPPMYLPGMRRRVVATDTFFSVAFSGVSCAEFWDNVNRGSNNRLADCFVCAKIAMHGNVQVLKWARRKGFPWDESTIFEAAGKGHVECLKYAHENGCTWDSNTCDVAAVNGHLECLIYAHDKGCPWTVWTCASAALHGQLEVLKHLHVNGCPMDCLTFRWAKNAEIAEWAQKNGCPV